MSFLGNTKRPKNATMKAKHLCISHFEWFSLLQSLPSGSSNPLQCPYRWYKMCTVENLSVKSAYRTCLLIFSKSRNLWGVTVLGDTKYLCLNHPVLLTQPAISSKVGVSSKSKKCKTLCAGSQNDTSASISSPLSRIFNSPVSAPRY